MTEAGIDRYIEELCARLTADPLITSFRVVRRQTTAFEGYYRIAAKLMNDDMLEAAAYIVCQGGEVVTVDYRFHWMSCEGVLRVRWDNSPHHPELSGFPYHRHEGSGDAVQPDRPMDLYSVLDEIATRLRS